MSHCGSPAQSLLALAFLLLAFTQQVFSAAANFNDFLSEDNVFFGPADILNGTWTTNATADSQETIIAYADNLISQGPWSVTYKTILAPSGDKHDYLSWAPYWWPDCSNAHNTTALTPQQIWVTCVYVNKDGQFNPDYRMVNDSGAFAGLADAVLFASQAWVLTGNDKYASAATSFINTWFVDNSTRMNPNLNFAQIVRGPPPNGGKATHTGVLDLKNMAKIATGILIFRSANYSGWTSEIDAGFVAWAKPYITWLETNTLGVQELAAPNNHGTFAYNQLASLQILVGDKAGALTTLNKYFSTQYLAQIVANGDQPLESARTRPYHYRAYNLGAMITNAQLSQYLGTNVWNLKTTAGATIQSALDYAITFNASASGETDSAPASELYSHVATVASVYGDPNGKYGAYLLNVDNKFPERPYFFYSQPLALPKGYVTSAANATGGSGSGGSGVTSSKGKGGGAEGRAALALATVSLWTVALVGWLLA